MSNKPSLRQFLDALDSVGALRRVTRRVDPEFEIGAILGLRDAGPAQLFETVDGPGLAVVGNVLNSRARFALAFGIAPEALDDHCAEPRSRARSRRQLSITARCRTKSSTARPISRPCCRCRAGSSARRRPT